MAPTGFLFSIASKQPAPTPTGQGGNNAPVDQSGHPAARPPDHRRQEDIPEKKKVDVDHNDRDASEDYHKQGHQMLLRRTLGDRTRQPIPARKETGYHGHQAVEEGRDDSPPVLSPGNPGDHHQYGCRQGKQRSLDIIFVGQRPLTIPEGFTREKQVDQKDHQYRKAEKYLEPAPSIKKVCIPTTPEGGKSRHETVGLDDLGD